MDDTPERLADLEPLERLERQYIDLLLAGERHRAAELVIAHADAGVTVKNLYLRVFEPAQVEIGQRWQRNEISVAHEHYCTAATQLIMSMLYPRMFGGDRNGRRLVAATVAGNLHEIGARMVADFFEFDGWDTYFTGADTPLRAVVASVAEREAHAVALSATLSQHVAGLAELVAAIRAEPATAGVLVLVGGRPFLYDPELWRRIGADGTATDAQGAVDLAASLLSTS
ncbi:MAG: cobalamin-dependent protein [Ilumatobacteraceae bacterium]